MENDLILPQLKWLKVTVVFYTMSLKSLSMTLLGKAEVQIKATAEK